LIIQAIHSFHGIPFIPIKTNQLNQKTTFMKIKYLFFVAAITTLSFAACTDAPDSDSATTGEAKSVDSAGSAGGETYNVDPASSKVEFIGTKVTGFHLGEIKIKSGALAVNDGNITGGNFVMDMTSLDIHGGSDTAADNKLEGHLKSPDFFEVQANPEATFVVTSVKPFSGSVTDTVDKRQEAISKYKVSNPTHTISGNLTIKGVTKNIEFPAQVSVSPNSVDALAKFNIDRREWNIVYPGKPDDLIRDQVHLGIALKAAK
jgi:polyisoprenoid-binding protein YceI